jgi:hypothetical protein
MGIDPIKHDLASDHEIRASQGRPPGRSKALGSGGERLL